MTEGYWPTDYWPNSASGDYWVDDYWPDYGAASWTPFRRRRRLREILAWLMYG